MLVYKSGTPESDTVQTTVTIPRHLRAYAKEKRISLSGTLRLILEQEYEKEKDRDPATNHASTPSRKPHKQNAEADKGLEMSKDLGECGYESI